MSIFLLNFEKWGTYADSNLGDFRGEYNKSENEKLEIFEGGDLSWRGTYGDVYGIWIVATTPSISHFSPSNSASIPNTFSFDISLLISINFSSESIYSWIYFRFIILI